MPFAQRLSLGWVIVGEVCLGKVHTPEIVSVNKTYILPDGRASLMKPCEYNLNLKDNINSMNSQCFGVDPTYKGDAIFLRTPEDNKVGPSLEDKDFLKLMGQEMHKCQDGLWTAPLPFKNPRPRLPNNKTQAWRRAQILDNSLKRNEEKRGHFVAFMGKVFDSGSAEIAPKIEDGERWYLPFFGVYHPKKPGQLRGVFDSSAVYKDISLNRVLMSGPDMINSLLGILLRFRNDKIAVTADVEQMFYRFRVQEDHRNFLRFFWYEANDPDKKLIEYRMRVHVFGNCSSPAVATYGLRKSVQNADPEVKNFVCGNFYVDDALASKPNVAEATDLVKKTQAILKQEGNIRLHKIASNSLEVMAAFPKEDLGSNLKTLDFSAENLPTQRRLGVSWELKSDSFIFNVSLENKPFTRRGVLSIVNSIFDPLGFIAPITITGKILLREATAPGVDWDAPLPSDKEMKWSKWKDSLQNLQEVSIPRMFTTLSLSVAADASVYIFSDASEKAIASVAYLKVSDTSGETSTGFILGKAKLAPAKGHTIPRLELCGAVLATEIAETISEQMDIPLDKMTYFTESKVVLGYICNKTRRFFTYVSNRVERILNVSSPEQWRYVPTEKNPADFATRCAHTFPDINNSIWINGPSLIQRSAKASPETYTCFDLLNPDKDSEIRPKVRTLKVNEEECFTTRFEKFSTWESLIPAFTQLEKAKEATVDKLTYIKDTENFVTKRTQRATYDTEIALLEKKRPVPGNSSIVTLNPFLNNDGILRVGGRIGNAEVSNNMKHPVIIPQKSHLALLLVRHHHNKVHHQGRLITEATIRSRGFWIIGAKRLVSSVIHKCVLCRKLRGNFKNQRMAYLPTDRVSAVAPFTVVGVDTFGPWTVIARKTRGGHSENKRWAILFTCLATRAVHIEVIAEMSSSAFINALRRFVALRGPVREFRSDRGTNFVGALDDIHAKGICVEKGPVNKHLLDSGVVWKFNPPHASHMGGVWERLIGLARRILDFMLLKSHNQRLTHEVLSTFMCEVSAVINSRPIAPLSYDPEDPEVISPALLLTQKKEPLQGIDTSMNIRDIYKHQWKHVNSKI